MNNASLLIVSLILLYAFQKCLAFWKAVRSVQNHPGDRLLFSPATFVSNFFPKIRGLTAGRNRLFNEKHDLFASDGCDIRTSISMLPHIRTAVDLADAAAIKEVTSSRARFPKPVHHYRALTFYGHNIVASEGEEWKKYRKISAPAFSDRNNKMVWDATVEIMKGLFNDVWANRDVIAVDHCVDITLPIALFVIGAAGFGRSISWKEDTKIPPGHTMTFKDALHIVTTDFFIKLIVPPWAMGLTQRTRTCRTAFDELRRYMSEMIQARQKEEKAERHDLFSSLLEANDHILDVTTLTEDELIGNIYIFLVAGHETTAHTLCFTFAMLALYPDEQEKLYQHIRSVLPRDRTPSYEEMPLFTYSMAVFYETLRMFPPVTGIPKVAAEDTSLLTINAEGEQVRVPIPKGTDITISTPALHFNPRYWDDPHSFKPARFLKDWPRDAFLPFSAGARACLGRKFFETEGIAILTMLVSQYKVSVKEEPQFAGETFEQRKSRILAARAGLTVTSGSLSGMNDSIAHGDDRMDVDVPPASSSVVSRSELQPRRPRASSVPAHVSKHTVGYVYSAEMLSHFSPHGHPEQPKRIECIRDALVGDDLLKAMKWIPIREVRKEEALLVHGEDHWNKVIAIQYMTDQQRADMEDFYEQLSLYVMSGTTRAALLSCGGVVEACLAVARKELKKTFAIVRPPGHHAEPDEHMGFCFFNNVAVAARVVQQRTSVRRILILDWDVHHGNGTQRAFNEDPSVLYISLHRYEQGTFYPCGPFGSMTSCGEGPGLGYSVNVPWPEKGMGDAEYIYAFQKVIMPIAMEFAPELVIISAGFDAAQGDELGECLVTPAGYAHMTHMLAGLAGGRLVGGYNLTSISKSALAVARVLVGQAPDELPPLRANEAATETVWQVAREQSKYWKSVDPKSCEPPDEVEPISFSLPEILKAHRQQYLYTKHDMMQVPMMTAEMDERFSSQVMCTSDLFDNNTLVLFVHEFGNLRLELESSATCDAQLERSYLIDFSKELIRWVKSQGYSLLDANLFPKPIVNQSIRHKSMEDAGKDLLLYLWDNYVQLSSAQRIIVIGHGPGCRSLTHLVNKRTVSVTKTVKGFIQVVGAQRLPAVPANVEDARTWFEKVSLSIVPSSHPILGPSKKPDGLRKYGTIVPLAETRQIKLITVGLPAIKQFVDEALSTSPLSNRTNRA